MPDGAESALKAFVTNSKPWSSSVRNLGIAFSDQREISLFLGFCHMGLLEEAGVTR